MYAKTCGVAGNQYSGKAFENYFPSRFRGNHRTRGNSCDKKKVEICEPGASHPELKLVSVRVGGRVQFREDIGDT